MRSRRLRTQCIILIDRRRRRRRRRSRGGGQSLLQWCVCVCRVYRNKNKRKNHDETRKTYNNNKKIKSARGHGENWFGTVVMYGLLSGLNHRAWRPIGTDRNLRFRWR